MDKRAGKGQNLGGCHCLNEIAFLTTSRLTLTAPNVETATLIGSATTAASARVAVKATTPRVIRATPIRKQPRRAAPDSDAISTAARQLEAGN